MPRCHECDSPADVDSSFCAHCGVKLVQPRERAATCLCGRSTWEPRAICSVCRSEHEDEVGERMADAW